MTANLSRNGKPGSVTELMAAWLQGLIFSAIPADVVLDAKLRFLDILGCTLAASSMEYGRIVRKSALRLGAGSESRVLGFGDMTSAASAAVANGAMAHALDYDDTNSKSLIHVSGPIVTTALTLGEALRADGESVLTAAIAGSELTCRIGSAAPGFVARGYHATGVVGAFGSAFVAAKLLGLSAEKTRHAMGIVGSQAAGLMECFTDGTWTKGLHPGWASHCGIAAAYLADDGFTGPATVLEGTRGLFRTHLGDADFPYGKICEELGAQWISLTTSYKPYPCGHVVHPFLDAVLILYREHGLRAEHVKTITCRAAPWMIPIMGAPREIKLRPQTAYHAKFSFFYTIAAALTFGGLSVETFSEENIGRPDLLALAERIYCTPDPHAPPLPQFKGWLIVETTDGRRLEQVVENGWGSPANPLTSDQIRQKFRENARLAMPDDLIELVIAATDRLEKLHDIGKLIDLCCRPTTRSQQSGK